MGIVKTLGADERAKLDLGVGKLANIVSESGLYKLIFKSRKPEAEKFKDWLAKEVIPAIRKTGH
ncbi:MAG: hypothetical protein CVU52_01440 [Deltaproteobacteria bacterium HGW-Deltaproteobacteria-10]|nr:MAG: hypothetical protein CVU52_01440 [Deltaproteobacteria bacterium HGW-Deltaproteobacteria-10]